MQLALYTATYVCTYVPWKGLWMQSEASPLVSLRVHRKTVSVKSTMQTYTAAQNCTSPQQPPIIHTYVHTHLHTNIHRYIQTYKHMYLQSYIQ